MFLNGLYALLLILASPWIAWRVITQGRYRRGWKCKLFGVGPAAALALTNSAANAADSGDTTNSGDRGSIGNTPESDAADGRPAVWWLHAVSVGEVNLLPTLVQRLEDQVPDAVFVISTSTDTGFDLAVQHFGSDRVFFAPLDFTWAVRRTCRNLRCKRLILAELELWPNLITAAKSGGARVSVINARMSPRSGRRYRKFRFLLGGTFGRLDQVGCQDTATRDAFIDCGADRGASVVTGSIKFDNAPTDRCAAEVLRHGRWAGVAAWHRVWVLGSSGEGEESMVLDIFAKVRKHHPELRLIIVPRHAPRFDDVAKLIEAAEFRCARVSRVADASEDWPGDRVILVDTIGQLRDWWGLAHIATVGGTFIDRGGQNMIEPAGYGAALCFGPDTRNFALIARLMEQADAAVRVADAAALESFVRRCLDDPAATQSLSLAAKRWVQTHQGALEKTVRLLLEN